MKVKLGDIFEIGSGGTPVKSHPEYYNGDIPWVKTGDLKSEYLFEVEDFITEKGLENSSAKMYEKDTVLIAMYGATIGATSILKMSACTNQACAAFKKNEKVIPEYLYYFLKSKKEKFVKDGVGGAQPNISVGYLKKTEMELLLLKEQRKIVDILDRISEMVLKRNQEIQLLDDLIKARFVEMFDGKYSEDTLVNLCNIIDYRGKTPEKVACGLPFITAKNVKMHHMTLEPREYISKETYDKVMVRGVPKGGDVVFTTEAPLGNVCRIPYFDTEFYIGQRIVTMQTNKLNPIYLEYALSDQEFVRKYMGKSSGSTVMGIRVRLLEQLTIPVPPRILQDQFADFVDQVDKSKVAVQKALDETQMLFDSLMQKYFA